MSPTDLPDRDDAALFREAIGDVRPLQQQRRGTPGGTRPPPVPAQSRSDERQVLADLRSDPFAATDTQPGDELRYLRPGLPRSLLRKLKRGHYRVDDELDLHGLSAASAKSVLTAFLVDAQLRRLRCVRIIHGKGLRSNNQGPVLKGQTAGWLIRRDEVLAYCSARRVDGGTGALYVLLRRKD